MVFRGPCLDWEPPVPPGYKFEWQVLLDPCEDGTPCWGVYDELYQRCLTITYYRHGPGAKILYQPGRSQKYEIDLDRMTQTRISCWPGWGSRRDIRCVIVPVDGYDFHSPQVTQAACTIEMRNAD